MKHFAAGMVMVLSSLAATSVSAQSAPTEVAAADEGTIAAAREFVRHAGVMPMYELLIARMLRQLEETDGAAPGDFRTTLLQAMPEDVVEDAIVRSLAAHASATELRQGIAFQKTEAGRVLSSCMRRFLLDAPQVVSCIASDADEATLQAMEGGDPNARVSEALLVHALGTQAMQAALADASRAALARDAELKARFDTFCADHPRTNVCRIAGSGSNGPTSQPIP